MSRDSEKIQMLNKCNFQIASLAPEGEGVPAILSGILVSPESTMVTDGGLGVMVSSVTSPQNLLFEAEGVEVADFFTEFVLDKESALKVAKAIPKPKKDGETTAKFAVVDATSENNDRAMVSVNDLNRQEILRANKIKGDFPKLIKAIPPKSKAKFTVHLDPHRLLAMATAVAKFCSAHASPTVSIGYYGPGQVLRFDVSAIQQDFTGVFAPQRADEAEAYDEIVAKPRKSTKRK
jgi:hypothetical protein